MIMSGLGLRAAAVNSRTMRAALACSQLCRMQLRALHQRRQLSYPVEEGLGTFLPPHTLKMIAEDYQQGLLDRLNDQVRGTSLENKSLVQTIINAAQDPNRILDFNYASEALNNSFFMGSLKPPPANAPSHEAALYANDTGLVRRIHNQYGSLAHFQSSFSAAVLGMFSTGWIWFVTDSQGNLGIIPTFGAGTLLVASSKESPSLTEWIRVMGHPTVLYDEPPPLDPSLPSAPPQASSTPSPSSGSGLGAGAGFAPTSPLSGISHGAPALDPHTPVRSMSSYESPRGMYSRSENETNKEENKRKAGALLHPLLCVSVHEHAWINAGYGVWGKEEYMKRFWTVVDWDNIKRLYRRVV